jgi:hypothetical protein
MNSGGSFALVQVRDYFQLIQVFATMGLVYYAYVKEAKNNRRKDTVERMLENSYSPMREIEGRARNDNTGSRLLGVLSVYDVRS